MPEPQSTARQLFNVFRWLVVLSLPLVGLIIAVCVLAVGVRLGELLMCSYEELHVTSCYAWYPDWKARAMSSFAAAVAAAFTVAAAWIIAPAYRAAAALVVYAVGCFIALYVSAFGALIHEMLCTVAAGALVLALMARRARRVTPVST